jgi:hypothetical protein
VGAGPLRIGAEILEELVCPGGPKVVIPVPGPSKRNRTAAQRATVRGARAVLQVGVLGDYGVEGAATGALAFESRFVEAGRDVHARRSPS